jgi:hypothetical protein
VRGRDAGLARETRHATWVARVRLAFRGTVQGQPGPSGRCPSCVTEDASPASADRLIDAGIDRLELLAERPRTGRLRPEFGTRPVVRAESCGPTAMKARSWSPGSFMAALSTCGVVRTQLTCLHAELSKTHPTTAREDPRLPGHRRPQSRPRRHPGVAMQMTGHETRSVFERYNIVSAGDLHETARRLDIATGTLGVSGTLERNRPGRSPDPEIRKSLCDNS